MMKKKMRRLEAIPEHESGSVQRVSQVNVNERTITDSLTYKFISHRLMQSDILTT